VDLAQLREAFIAIGIEIDEHVAGRPSLIDAAVTRWSQGRSLLTDAAARRPLDDLVMRARAAVESGRPLKPGSYGRARFAAAWEESRNARPSRKPAARKRPPAKRTTRRPAQTRASREATAALTAARQEFDKALGATIRLSSATSCQASDYLPRAATSLAQLSSALRVLQKARVTRALPTNTPIMRSAWNADAEAMRARDGIERSVRGVTARTASPDLGIVRDAPPTAARARAARAKLIALRDLARRNGFEALVPASLHRAVAPPSSAPRVPAPSLPLPIPSELTGLRRDGTIEWL